MEEAELELTRAQISRAAIRRLHISMSHLFLRGSYKPLGVSGEAMISALLDLEPEIYGSMKDPDRVEISGLTYIFQRLPEGIEECRYVRLISKEGYEDSGFEALIPAKRRRNCYRIDKKQMYIEMTRGKSDIYDVLTHLTFMYIEAEKIRGHALDHRNRKRRDWKMLEEIILKIESGEPYNSDIGCSYLANLMGRTYEETAKAIAIFEKLDKVNSLFNIVYWLGRNSIEEHVKQNDREITFSSILKEKVGMHVYGEKWAVMIKTQLEQNGLLEKPIHIISSNLHSVMNSLFAKAALGAKVTNKSLEETAELLSKASNSAQNTAVKKYALKNGMIEVSEKSGTNIGVQIFDLCKIDIDKLPSELSTTIKDCNSVIIVMDYAFGEQAYECMDELLKPFETATEKLPLDIRSINIMGKAGILTGNKSDIMIPTAHIFEGSADNYPLLNSLTAAELQDPAINTYEGNMITVLGTSLQNKDILRYFHRSSWKAIGLEMEGAHYQKAIQVASAIRSTIRPDVVLRYAYYASDNPLETGSTLASGGLGIDGVKPTYLITTAILNGIMSQT